MLPLLDFGHPTAHAGIVDPRDWWQIPPPPRAACGVWLPPSRPTPRSLATPDAFRRRMPASATSALERPWASPYKGFPSTAIGTPLGALCPPAVTPHVFRPPEGFRCRRGADFRALIPRRVRSNRSPRSKLQEHRTPIPNRVLVPRQSMYPLELAAALIAMASLHALGWGDVPIHPGHKVSGSKRVG